MYTTSMEYFFQRGGVHHLNGILIQRGVVHHLNGIYIQRGCTPPQRNIYPEGGCIPLQWNIYPGGGVYTTSVEYLSRGGRTPPQWNIFPGLPFSSMPHFSTLFFLSGGRVPLCCMVSHSSQSSIFTMVFLLVGGVVWGGRQEARKGGGGYHTFIRLFLSCVLFYVLDTRCQIRLQTSNFIHILDQHSLAFSPLHLRRHAGLVFLSWNIGGVAGHVDFVIHVLLALEVDCFALQELWSFEPLLQALPSSYAYHTSSAEGCGTGFMVGWRRSLQHPATKPRVEHDA